MTTLFRVWTNRWLSFQLRKVRSKIVFASSRKLSPTRWRTCKADRRKLGLACWSLVLHPQAAHLQEVAFSTRLLGSRFFRANLRWFTTSKNRSALKSVGQRAASLRSRSSLTPSSRATPSVTTRPQVKTIPLRLSFRSSSPANGRRRNQASAPRLS